MTSKTQVMHNIFNKHNRSNIQLVSKWNKHHLFSNPCLKLIFRHINVFFNLFWNTIHFFLEKPHYLWFLKWYVCLQCNSGPRISALFIFWPFSMMTEQSGSLSSPTALAKYSSMWHDFSILIIPLHPQQSYASNRLLLQVWVNDKVRRYSMT